MYMYVPSQTSFNVFVTCTPREGEDVCYVPWSNIAYDELLSPILYLNAEH